MKQFMLRQTKKEKSQQGQILGTLDQRDYLQSLHYKVIANGKLILKA